MAPRSPPETHAPARAAIPAANRRGRSSRAADIGLLVGQTYIVDDRQGSYRREPTLSRPHRHPLRWQFRRTRAIESARARARTSTCATVSALAPSRRKRPCNRRFAAVRGIPTLRILRTSLEPFGASRNFSANFDPDHGKVQPPSGPSFVDFCEMGGGPRGRRCRVVCDLSWGWHVLRRAFTGEAAQKLAGFSPASGNPAADCETLGGSKGS